jgi:hypothetical protein
MADFPYADRVEVDPRKLTDYLLAPAHPVGRSKARFFAALGFFQADAHRFEEAIRALVKAPLAVETRDSGYGTKYIVEGRLEGPRSGAVVRTVWIVEPGADAARFVTAYPRSST